ncbi:MAG: cytochrome c biogenesis protein ResB [Verrucomicrobia bacterium]|nr:cytochrome c biogenesis protein ResB [Verrucomicrobiota bacterium]
MNATLRSLRDLFVSPQLSVVLLVLGMLLIFAATLDQVNLGIWAVQEKYFRSFVIYTRLGSVAVPVFPGGYTIGGLLLINLVAAHVYRFSFTARKAGIQLTHAGLILLLVGELLTGLWQEDYNLRLTEGETRNYAESYRDNELVVVDTTDAQFDDVVTIPERRLAGQAPLQHPKLPFRVVPKAYYPNSVLQARPADATHRPGGQVSLATTGLGERVLAAPQPITYRQDERNLPSAYVELVAADRSLGTYLVSTGLVMPQVFEYGGRQWKIALRVKRAYKPYALTLLKFTFDRYAGTEIPKNFSSRIRLKTPDGRDDREVLIYMNNPLRYAGLTFYQSGFERDERTTILQVVRNPSWLLPYIACALMTLGLIVQFCFHLVGFVGKRRPVAAIKTTPA